MIELEISPGELGEIRAVPPDEVWILVRERDAQGPTPVPIEGEETDEPSS